MPSDETGATRWEGYSDYQRVSINIAEAVDRALDNYAHLDGKHAEGARVDPELAAEARASILSAALRLVPELRADRQTVEEYDRMLGDWGVLDDDGRGYVDQLDAATLQSECPEWLFQFVLDIRVAGWKLGYLQAGRNNPDDSDVPEGEKQPAAMMA